jgi:NAD(P)-dependent dehydrogenase (short-subunit alcohol dehydrogenase family)
MYKGFDLSGKVAALTGSTAGMGFAIARGLAQCGAKIVVSSNTQEDTEQAAHALSKEGFDVAGVRCDITDRRDIGQFGTEAKRAFGKVDILFCVAVGPVSIGPVHESDLDALDNLLISTVSSNLALAQQFLPEMAERRYGSIVMMSSIASQRASPLLGGYGAAKAALNGIVRSIAVEWGASNVRANAIAPSMVRTAFSKDFWGDPEREKVRMARTPAGRIAEPEEVVGAAILLASPAGAYISGQVLLIDGARSVT